MSGEGEGRMGEKVEWIRRITGRHKIDREVRNSIGNGEAKELIWTTHGHELKGGRGWCWRVAGYRAEGDIGEKNWDNRNSKINKIYFKK